MALDTSSVVLSVTGSQSNAIDFTTGIAPLARTYQMLYSTGTGAGSADRIWHDQRTIAPSGTDDLDLAGVLTDVFGATVTFARVKALMVAAASGNTNNVIVGNAATNGFITWVGAATHTVTVRPGGFLALAASDATSYAVTAGTGDLLRIANSGAGTSVVYDIVVIGASA
jgi:hypothetical protein